LGCLAPEGRNAARTPQTQPAPTPEAIRGPVRRSRTPRAVNRANESIPSPHHPVRTTLRERSIRSPWTWLITSRLHFRPCSACHARLHQGFHHVLSLVAAIQPAYWTLDLVEAPDPARGQDAPNAASGDRDGRSLGVGGSSRSCPGSGRRASFLSLTDWSGRRVSPRSPSSSVVAMGRTTTSSGSLGPTWSAPAAAVGGDQLPRAAQDGALDHVPQLAHVAGVGECACRARPAGEPPRPPGPAGTWPAQRHVGPGGSGRTSSPERS